jgi:hypothetical protein
LLAALVVSQSVIEEPFLPNDAMFVRVKMFPVADDTAH